MKSIAVINGYGIRGELNGDVFECDGAPFPVGPGDEMVIDGAVRRVKSVSNDWKITLCKLPEKTKTKHSAKNKEV